MQKNHSRNGSGRYPFPKAGPTQEQNAEDTFMRAHGGLGNRLVYRVVQAFSFVGRTR